MTAHRSGSTKARAMLAMIVLTVAAGCDRTDIVAPAVPTRSTPPVPETAPRLPFRPRPGEARGIPMTGEQARQQAIQRVSALLAAAKAGVGRNSRLGVGLSDGRQLAGAEAITFTERVLHALTTGEPASSAWRTAASSSTTAPPSLSTAATCGFVVGATWTFAGSMDASAGSTTAGGYDAVGTYVEGEIFVRMYKDDWWPWPNQYQTGSAWYAAIASGREVSAGSSVGVPIGYQVSSGMARAFHAASYGEDEETGCEVRDYSESYY